MNWTLNIIYPCKPKKAVCPKCNTGADVLNYVNNHMTNPIERHVVYRCENKDCQHTFKE
ncbi:hypothetical protein [Bacillus phage vB_BanS-Thrax2]|nr:hypothetical protein [Bacillus phage vB_BanS-Thrax2]